MKTTLIALICCLALASATLTTLEYKQKYTDVTSGNVPITEELTHQMYTAFLQSYGKSVESDDVDRYQIFAETVKVIAAHNSNEMKTWTMGINEYSDRTEEEFFEHFRLNENNEQEWSATASPKINYQGDIPAEHDWRKISMPHSAKVVTPVKNQGKCGSWWAFSTVGAMESHYLLMTTKYAILSEQQLVDCGTPEEYNLHGCSGGLPSYAFDYIRDHGITFEKTIPYKGEEQECRYTEYDKVILTKGPFNIEALNEDQLTESVYNQGPISVAFQVVGDFRNYESGVYSSTECKNGKQDVNHAVLAVGYGNENGKDHYIIKNSWGTEWGDEGFFKIERGVNMCGIAVCNSYPTGVSDIYSSDVEFFMKQN